MPILRKLAGFIALTTEERRAIEALYSDTITLAAGTDLIREGDRPERVHLLMDGWAYRYKLLPDGGRQILAHLIPGDLCDIHIFILRTMDHSIGLLSDATIGLIHPTVLIETMDRHPRIARALWWATLVDEATLREWLVNVARRDPYDRIAHLFCELWFRMKAVGLADSGGRIDLPLTQTEIGDTVGLTPVTVNRVLQRLRQEEIIPLRAERLTILDLARLQAAASFDANYLHLMPRDEPGA